MDYESEKILKLIFPNGVPGKRVTNALRPFSVNNFQTEHSLVFRAFAFESGAVAAHQQTGHTESGPSEKRGVTFGGRESRNRRTNARPRNHQLQGIHSNV